MFISLFYNNVTIDFQFSKGLEFGVMVNKHGEGPQLKLTHKIHDHDDCL